MGAQETIDSAERALAIKRAFGEPYVHDRIAIIRVARVVGHAGGGGGDGPQGRGEGSGLDLGVEPTGVFRVDGNQVSWHPALNVNRIVTCSALVAALLSSLRDQWSG